MSRIVLNDVNMGWVHEEDDTRHVPRDAICYLVPGEVQTSVGGGPPYAGPVSPYSAAAKEPVPTMAGTNTTNDADRVQIVH